jgi:tetratricopeptide (TPR) repeat protein
MCNLLCLMLVAGALSAQTQTQNSSGAPKSQSADSPSFSQSKAAPNPKLAPPRSDRVDAASLGEASGESSSKDTQIDLTAPPGDAKEHPQSADILMDEGSSDGGGTTEFHPWDPHKAAKDVEVGDYYFKRKNYIGAEGRYREALLYKENDADATYKLAVCLEKMQRTDEAIEGYQSYLKILPSGPDAVNAKKAIDRLKAQAASAKSEH